jgi:hypothetical protein
VGQMPHHSMVLKNALELPAEVQGPNPNWGGTCAQAKCLHIVLTLSVLLIDFHLNTFESNMFICITTKCRIF